jgi:hypothetical protein
MTILRSPNHDDGESRKPERWLDSLFELEGLGKEHWKNVDPDEFVRQLREGRDEPHDSQES